MNLAAFIGSLSAVIPSVFLVQASEKEVPALLPLYSASKGTAMTGNRPDAGLTVCVLLTLCLSVGVTAAQAPAGPPVPTLGCAEIEIFLKTAKIGRPKGVPVGVTGPSKAPLDDGKVQHDVLIQTIDVSRPSYQTRRGTELNFRDAWQFNVAGYELAKMLELNMVPPYVERAVSGVPASLSWWVNDAMMERDRFQKKISPPDVARWTAELSATRVFHELIADTDFNMTNLLIAKDWRVWMIDFSRAFRLTKSLRGPKNLTRVDRKLLANLRGTDARAAAVAARTMGERPADPSRPRTPRSYGEVLR